ncbi:Crossover junction endonuclease EME1B [Bienertia sinuspersici]
MSQFDTDTPFVDLTEDDDGENRSTINLSTPISNPNPRKRPKSSIPTQLCIDVLDDSPTPLRNHKSACYTTSFVLDTPLPTLNCSPLPILPLNNSGDDGLISNGLGSDDQFGHLGGETRLKNIGAYAGFDVAKELGQKPECDVKEKQRESKDSTCNVDVDRWLDIDSPFCLNMGMQSNVLVEGGDPGKRNNLKSTYTYDRPRIEDDTNQRQAVEVEKERKATLKAEAAELKQLEKEKKKLEKYKFSEKDIVAVIDSNLLSGSLGGPLLTMFTQKHLSPEINLNPIGKSIVWRMNPPEEISQLATRKIDIHYILLIYDNAEEFCNQANDGSLTDHISSVRKHYPSYTICCLTNRLMSFINKRLKALVSIPKVQPRFAVAIWKKYPTMKSLLCAYMDPTKTVSFSIHVPSFSICYSCWGWFFSSF